jgi:hypothetical protein
MEDHMHKLIAIAVLFSVIQLKAVADEKLPPGTVKHGTLANANLIRDAKVGVAGKVGTMGCNNLGDVDVYVTTMPVGTPGKRRWKELWIVSGCHKKYPVNIEFAESGNDADWTIR